MERLYIIVRADIPAGAQLAQACHAVAEFGVLKPERFASWATQQRNLVVLQAPSRTALELVLIQLLEEMHEVAAFHEPDLGNQLTAIAFGGEAAKLVSQLPLALRVAKNVLENLSSPTPPVD